MVTLSKVRLRAMFQFISKHAYVTLNFGTSFFKRKRSVQVFDLIEPYNYCYIVIHGKLIKLFNVQKRSHFELCKHVLMKIETSIIV